MWMWHGTVATSSCVSLRVMEAFFVPRVIVCLVQFLGAKRISDTRHSLIYCPCATVVAILPPHPLANKLSTLTTFENARTKQ